MKKIFKYLLVLVIGLFMFGCDVINNNPTDNNQDGKDSTEPVDYVSQLKLDMTTSSLKQEVTVKAFIDGDTTHFYVPKSIDETGILKARYIAIDTPESTGQIEEYGKKASNFTKDHLKSAVSIIIESDDEHWNADSTGTRYVVWVWYKADEQSEYRNLNLEILQNGLSKAKSSAKNRYGNICSDAAIQARNLKLNIFSGEKDPDFYYGGQIELTLKELRTNMDAYLGKKIAFEGLVSRNNSNTVYVQAYDEETDMTYGMSVFYGYGLSGDGLEILKVGNYVRIVGNFIYSENVDQYQVSNVYYDEMRPDDPDNIQLIEEIKEVPYPTYTIRDFNSKVKLDLITVDEEGEEKQVQKTFDWAFLSLNTTIHFDGLYVKDVYTTTADGSSSKGAMTLTCTDQDGNTVKIRTNVLYTTNEAGERVLVEESYFKGKTFSFSGLIESYEGSYQVKLLNVKDATLVE